MKSETIKNHGKKLVAVGGNFYPTCISVLFSVSKSVSLSDIYHNSIQLNNDNLQLVVPLLQKSLMNESSSKTFFFRFKNIP
jgi:hypothetical protein